MRWSLWWRSPSVKPSSATPSISCFSKSSCTRVVEGSRCQVRLIDRTVTNNSRMSNKSNTTARTVAILSFYVFTRLPSDNLRSNIDLSEPILIGRRKPQKGIQTKCSISILRQLNVHDSNRLSRRSACLQPEITSML